MAAIRLEPPQAPQWQLTISEDERGYLLAALDFARGYLAQLKDSRQVAPQWPLSAITYQSQIDSIERVIAAADAEIWRNG